MKIEFKVVSGISKENKEYDYTKFEAFDEDKQDEVYDKNISNVG